MSRRRSHAFAPPEALALALAVGIFVAGYLLWDFVIVKSVGVHIGAWANPLRHGGTRHE